MKKSKLVSSDAKVNDGLGRGLCCEERPSEGRSVTLTLSVGLCRSHIEEAERTREERTRIGSGGLGCGLRFGLGCCSCCWRCLVDKFPTDCVELCRGARRWRWRRPRRRRRRCRRLRWGVWFGSKMFFSGLTHRKPFALRDPDALAPIHGLAQKF